MWVMRRLLSTSAAFCLSTSFSLSDAYTNLQNSLAALQPIINLPTTPINWGTTLDLNYNVTLNNTVGGPLSFNGNGSDNVLFAMFPNANGVTVNWNGDFIFQNTAVIDTHVNIAPSTSFATFSASASTAHIVTFNGNVTFQNNAFIDQTMNASTGGAVDVDQWSQVTFNGPTNFINNSNQGQSLTGGGAIANVAASVLTFNQNSFFRGNTVVTQVGPAFGGALITGLGNAILNFNAPAIFIDNSATNNNLTSVGLHNNAYGGAVGVADGVITFINPQFINNQVIAPNTFAYGGAISLANSTATINATDPTTPVVFQGNTATDSLGTRQESFYLFTGAFGGPFIPGPSRLILNADANTLIDVHDGISSDGGGNTIIKQGPGTWQQSGNSSGYLDNTMITAGTFQLQPGAIYGTTSSGTVTIGPGGTLVFNVAPGSFPLLQGANINLNGATSVIGVLNTVGSGVVALTDGPILVNGASFGAGSVLQQGGNLFYDWQLVFANPSELDLIISRGQSICGVVEAAGGTQNDINVACVLDTFNVAANPGQLADYILAIENSSTPQEVLALVDPLQGEILTGGYELLWDQLTLFSIQMDERLNLDATTDMKPKGRIVLASADKQLPQSPWSPAPWVGWGHIFGGLGRQNAHDGSNAYDSHDAGLTAGFDRELDRNWRLGGALNLQRGLLDWDEYSGETRANTLAGSLYGSYDQDSWFARSQLGGGGTWINNRRDIPLTVLGQSLVTASSNTSLPFFQGRVSTGYHFDFKDIRFTPSAGLFYVHTDNNPFSETGAGEFNLHVNRSSQDNLEAQFNLELAYVLKINDHPVTFRSNYGVGFETLDKQATITTGFLSFPNLITFNASSLATGRWRFFTESGMDVEVAKNVRLRLDYIGIFQRHAYNNVGAVGLKIVF